MKADADRVLQAYTEKGKRAAEDLKPVQAPIEIKPEELEQFLDLMSEGTLRDCLERIAVRFVPAVRKIRDLLQQMLTRTPILARIEITRIVDGHFAARAGPIETDPDGRLIMQLAQYVDGEGLLLTTTLARIREKHQLDTGSILAMLFESPIFDPDRMPLLEQGLQAYLQGDHITAIHVLIPQIEYTLRRLLELLGLSKLRSGKNGTMQVKNLNEVLRESAIQGALGENIQSVLPHAPCGSTWPEHSQSGLPRLRVTIAV